MRIWRNWQTRMVQVHVRAISWRFKSSYPHHVGTDFAPFRFLFAQKSVTCAVDAPLSQSQARSARLCLLVNALAAARCRHHIFASVPAAKIPKLFSLPITNDTISNKNNHPRGRLFLFESLYLRAFIGFTLTHTRRPLRTTGVSEGV